MKIRSAIATGGLSLALIGGVPLTTATPAAALATQIDVGYTILQGGYWKGSGSYSNGSGQYARVCVSLWKTWEGPDSQLSISCRVASQGTSQAFSAPSVKCTPLVPHVFISTRVQAFDANNSVVATKTSNQIGAGSC
ncbi:hypothetical protein ACQPYK_01990 [Streptosporangium sp. CA-135522]|uniref:hypothetical protein n=1 Tax=Streptosporangium sp. CA-135522 TaxID=3240072 RepID=UPI003D8F8FA5